MLVWPDSSPIHCVLQASARIYPRVNLISKLLQLYLAAPFVSYTGALKETQRKISFTTKRRSAAGYLLIHIFNCFILAIAEVYKNEGNNSYRQNDFNNAIYFYTEGIKVNCKDEELKAKLCSNRAKAYFCLGEKILLG